MADRNYNLPGVGQAYEETLFASARIRAYWIGESMRSKAEKPC